MDDIETPIDALIAVIEEYELQTIIDALEDGLYDEITRYCEHHHHVGLTGYVEDCMREERRFGQGRAMFGRMLRDFALDPIHPS